MSLFEAGKFELHSGERSTWRINCESLSDEDIKTLAKFISRNLPAFGAVEGVPRGGLRLAEALRPYADVRSAVTLIVDDVLTTGASMEEQRADREGVLGVVIFARGPYPTWILPVFVVPGRWRARV